MTKREAKKRCWRQAYASLKSLVDCGWPYQMVDDDDDPPESPPDLERLEEAMEELIQHCFNKSG